MFDNVLLTDCNKLNELLKNEKEQNSSLLLEAIYTSLLIRLHDILNSLDKKQRSTVAFAGDITIDKQSNINDIFDLIRIHRNAACHTKSGWKYVNKKILFSFNVVKERCSNALKISGHIFGCDYTDDIALYYGPWRVYFKRHIQKLLERLNKLN